MNDAIASYLEWKTRTTTSVTKSTVPQETEPRDRQCGFTKISSWAVDSAQLPLPTSVEVVGSFNDWRKTSLTYDPVTKTWQVALQNLRGNHTHRYVLLVDGKPSYDKNCDGLAVPEGPDETKWQIPTAR